MTQWQLPAAGKAIRTALSDKEKSDDIYRAAMELTFPDRENFSRAPAEGQRKNTRSWDSTPTVSVIRAANRLSSDFTPQFQDWVEVKLGPAAEQMPDQAFKEAMGRSKDDVKLELEQTTSIVQAVYNGPGFPTASNELYIDWHFGQGGMQIMGNSDKLGEPCVFTAMPMSHFYAYEGPNGRLDRWFFWHELRADVIKRQWPDATLPEHIATEAEKPSPKLVKLCSVVYRDYDEQKKPYRYEVFSAKGTENFRLVERQYRTSPFVTPRYSKLAGENRGRGPVLFAIADIKTANKIVELTLRAVSVAVAGVYTSTDGVDGPVAIKPYSVIRVKHNAGAPNGPSLARLDNPQRIDYGQLVLDVLHENIRKVIGDHALPAESDPIRTATEFIQRARELIADQAGGLGRLLAEFIIPGTQRIVDILEDRQILKTDGLKIDQFLIEVRMSSPLAKGQAMQEVENLVRFIEMLKMLGGPALVAYEMNVGKTTSHIADLMDVPMDLRNDAATKQKLEKGLAQQMAGEQGGDPAVAGAAADAEHAAQNAA